MTQTIEPAVAAETGYDRLEVRPVVAAIGAEVRGLLAGPDLDPAAVADLRRALLKHKVVFLRDQHGVDIEGQRALAEQLGVPTTPHPTVAGENGVLPIDSETGKANSWHTDVTFVDRIPAFGILRAVHLPPYGGTTVWANTVTAYETLHPALQALADRLWAVHSNLYDYAADQDETRIGGIDVKEQAYRDEFAHLEFETEHPLVRVHPETGERTLFVSPSFLKSIVGLSPRESQVLLEFLWEHIVRPEFTVRFRWEPGSVAFWDNRATSHLAPRDIFDSDFERQFYRVTLVGDVPVGVDGKASTSIEGEPIGAV